MKSSEEDGGAHAIDRQLATCQNSNIINVALRKKTRRQVTRKLMLFQSPKSAIQSVGEIAKTGYLIRACAGYLPYATVDGE